MVLDVEFEPEDTAIEEATVSSWFVDEGEAVEAGDVLVEMVTADDTIEVRAPDAGTILELRVEEDESVKVGDVLCLIDTANVMDYVTDEDEEEDYDDEDDEI